MKKETLKNLIAVAAALAVWQIASMFVGQEILLASPLAVLKTLAQIVATKSFWSTVLFSTLRILAGFLAAFAAGVILGVIASRFEWVKILLRPFMVCIRSVPVASFIVLSLIWMSASQLTTFVCFLACLPAVYNNVAEGIANVDPAQKEAALNLGAGWLKTVRAVILPNIEPYLAAAVSTACGMAFKAGVAAEVVAIVSGSIGEQIYMSKVYFETAGLFAWTIVVVALSFVFEKLFRWLLALMIRKVV